MAERMGGSQSKFTPHPQDVWYKMKLTGKHPRYLQTVMQAIVDLKEPEGSTQSRLIDHIQRHISARNIVPKPRNITLQVKRALAHGVKNGLVKLRGGKFNLALSKKDFAIFKNFRADDPLKDCGRCRRKRKSKRRGRRRSKSKRRGTEIGYKRHRSDTRDSDSSVDLKRRRTDDYDDSFESGSSWENIARSYEEDRNNSCSN